MITEEQIIEQAFALFAPDDADWGGYKERRAGLRTLLSTYAAQERLRERQWVALYLEGRAGEIAADNTNAALWMARIFRDEAAAIRENIPPTQEG